MRYVPAALRQQYRTSKQNTLAAPGFTFGKVGQCGSIVVGADADLVLLDANPLADIANTQKIAGVMVRGRWLDRAFLDRELQAVAARVGQ